MIDCRVYERKSEAFVSGCCVGSSEALVVHLRYGLVWKGQIACCTSTPLLSVCTSASGVVFY